MNRILSRAVDAVLIAGFAVLCWVAAGYVGHKLLALSVTVLIGAFYLLGALELLRFRQATDGLVRALAGLSDAPASLPAWLERLHPSLRNAVRLRIEGDRVGLPGPALTPYLAGLLVLLGMTGTFLGMVVTLKGTGLALDSASDLESVRASLAAPVNGLGLAFGTSVAGVAASAMLGLAAALCRRERIEAGQRLDHRIATSLRLFSAAHRRDESLRLLEQQTLAMPLLVERLQAMMQAIEQRAATLEDGLLARQERFLAEAATTHASMAAAVGDSLRRSLDDGARIAAATIQPLAESTMAGIAREAAMLHRGVAATVEQQLTAMAGSLDAATRARDDERLAAWSAAFAGLSQQTVEQTRGLAQEAVEHTRGLAQETIEQTRDLTRQAAAQTRELTQETVAQTRTLVQVAAATPQAAAELVAEIRCKLDQSIARDHRMLDEQARVSEMLDRLLAKLESETAKVGEVAAQVGSGAAEVASLGESFGIAVQIFSESNAKLVEQLQRIEGTLAKSISRSDEQLAYYVAQAREVIDLSIMSQKQIVDDLQQFAGRRIAEGSAA